MIEAMKQLIEDCISMMEYHVEQTRPIHTTTVAIQAAKEALQAIAEAEQNKHGSPEDMYVEMHKHLNCPHCGGSGHIEDVAEKQEPVYLIWLSRHCAWLQTDKESFDKFSDDEKWALYTTPQPRKPLTDEQKKSIARRAFKDICKDYPVQDRIILVINDIESAHGIKE